MADKVESVEKATKIEPFEPVERQAPLLAGPSERDAKVAMVTNVMSEQGIMPALSKEDIPLAMAKTVVHFDGMNLGLQSDGGKSSGSALSTIGKACGADIRPTSSIIDLRKQLRDLGWKEIEYTPNEKLRPGDFVFTDEQPKVGPRNGAIVGIDGKLHTHSVVKDMLIGRPENELHSKFTTIVRPE